MEERRLYICGKCHHFWSGDKRMTTCPDCGSGVHPVELDYQTYRSWTDEQRRDFRQEYAATHLFPEDTADVPVTVYGRQKNGFWIRLLDTALNVMLFLYMVLAAGVFVVLAGRGGMQGFLIGLAAALLIVILSLLTIAGMKIFIGMAKDLKAIRNRMGV